MNGLSLAQKNREVIRHWNHHRIEREWSRHHRGPRHLNTNSLRGLERNSYRRTHQYRNPRHHIFHLGQHQARMYLHKLLLHLNNCNFLMSEQRNCRQLCLCKNPLCRRVILIEVQQTRSATCTKGIIEIYSLVQAAK